MSGISYYSLQFEEGDLLGAHDEPEMPRAPITPLISGLRTCHRVPSWSIHVDAAKRRAILGVQ